MEDFAGYAGRLLADRYRLPRPPSEEYEFAESLAWDTASGQEVLVRQVPLPEVIEAEVVEESYGPGRDGGPGGGAGRLRGSVGRATRRPADPVVRRAVEAAVAASRIPDHPRLDQVFDVFVEGDGLWIVSELVPARPLAALLAERPLGAHRAAEIAADLLAALRVVHAHGWAHRNITARTVLICEDGRALLTGLAVGAAEEALCGYDPLPEPGRVPAPPMGDIPDGTPGPGAGGPGERGAEPVAPQTPAAPVAPAAPETAPGERGDGGPGREPVASPYHDTIPYPGGRGPATWTGQPLPEGFDARPGGPPGPPGQDGARDRGIFGFDGVQPDEDDGYGPGGQDIPRQGGPGGPGGPGRPGQQGSPGQPGVRGDGGQAPVAHGYGTAGAPGLRGVPDGGEASARAARRGAIAAYRAGTQRAAAETRDGGDERASSGTRQGGGAAQRPAADWWSTAPAGPGHGARPDADGRGTDGRGAEGHGTGGALDDDVRWLSSGEDEVRPDTMGGPGVQEVERDEIYGPRAAGPYAPRPDESTGPTALPGARQGGSRSVRATWRTETPGGGEDTGDSGLGIFRNGQDDPGAGHGDAGYGSGPYGNGPYENSAYAGDGTSDEYGSYDEYGGYEGDPDGTGGGERWGGEEATEGRYRGPATALAAERARHTRMTVVGPVTERWAPEQAGPVYENWRLAPPVGPAADLWALGALLFRAVQGHAPYPEDSAAELVQMVCAEPPAFAEDCGPLRPVVESLMRQDPTERPDFEELRGWLRSLVRSAPEPEVGQRTVTAPPSLEAPAPADPRRLPIVRRRGELVRRRKAEKRPVVAEGRQRHKRGREKPPRGPRSPRRLGRLIVGLVLLGMAAAVVYAMWFMPKNNESSGAQKGSVVVPEEPEEKPQGGEDGAADGEKDGKGDGSGKGGQEKDKDGDKGKGGDKEQDKGKGGDRPPSSTGSAKAPKGYKTSNDPAGFRIAVPKEWDRRSTNGKGQVLYNGGDVTMIIVSGRDSANKYGKNPSTYQNDDEPELSAYRASDWTSTTGLRRIDVGDTPMAEGTFKWKDGGGRELYARNRAVLLDGRYHVLLVQGSQSKKAEIDRHFEAVADTYRVT
ncbi:hypothetical protein [Streptomyces sp. NPDC048172]|uniref:hypothetical protein n=1 Tax=Streptomyces sp. NPDC048172 TaxID=3365505 RepID=UPI00371BC52B